MADNRRPYQIVEDHARHVKENGHATYKMYQLPVISPHHGESGVVQLEVCTECPFMKVQCTHDMNSWDAEGKTLTCDLCGMDGT